MEDEPSAAQATTEALEAAGFKVITYYDAVSALGHAEGTDELIDLMVLDRRLPKRHGEAPTDKVGDELLSLMLDKHPDVVAVVFSGHTGFEHHQLATADRGAVSMRGKHVLDRVRLFEKGQSLEFDEYVARVHGTLSQLEDIQVRCANPEQFSLHDKRLLRRVAFEFGGASVEARPLMGGLTDSPVWLCSIDGENVPTARVVAKRQSKLPEPGGFQTLCPAQLTAGTITVVRGFCGGQLVTVQQLVDDEPVPLLELLGTDPKRAAAIVAALQDGLDKIRSGQEANLSIATIAEPVEHWDTVRNRAQDFSISVPPGSRIATTVRSAQHGDLHPGNVLASGDHPVVIDFDSQTVGSELVDVVGLLLGPLFHRDSPLRQGDWPTIAQCSELLDEHFLDGCPAKEYFEVVLDWVEARQRSPRELFTLLLAFTVRQLHYGDVVADDNARARAIAIAQWASMRLEEQ